MFDGLIGEQLPFFGAGHNEFSLGGYIFEAVEDGSDGYRSMLDEVRIVPRHMRNGIYFGHPIATVTIIPIDEFAFTGYQLVDEDGHVCLRMGTGDHDDYYPFFVFEYHPKANHA